MLQMTLMQILHHAPQKPATRRLQRSRRRLQRPYPRRSLPPRPVGRAQSSQTEATRSSRWTCRNWATRRRRLNLGSHRSKRLQNNWTCGGRIGVPFGFSMKSQRVEKVLSFRFKERASGIALTAKTQLSTGSLRGLSMSSHPAFGRPPASVHACPPASAPSLVEAPRPPSEVHQSSHGRGGPAGRPSISAGWKARRGSGTWAKKNGKRMMLEGSQGSHGDGGNTWFAKTKTAQGPRWLVVGQSCCFKVPCLFLHCSFVFESLYALVYHVIPAFMRQLGRYEPLGFLMWFGSGVCQSMSHIPDSLSERTKGNVGS